jgi:hypothetical protein
MATARTPNEVTVDEVIALLKKTSLPTLIVEGSDDMIVYRRFEDNLVHAEVSVLPVGGRLKVLEVFNRRHEIPLSVKMIFIADKDTWINTGIPPEFQDSTLVFTDGYSIENDVYRDGELWKLLRMDDRTRYEEEINSFIEWYALALTRHLADSTFPIALHHDQVLNPIQRPALLALKPAEVYPNALKQEIFDDYGRMLRGKSLLSLFIKHTNAKGRGARHTDSGLFEIVAVNPGVLLKDLLKRVEHGFQLV